MLILKWHTFEDGHRELLNVNETDKIKQLEKEHGKVFAKDVLKEDLKPCPFCGCEDIRKIEIEQYGGPWYFTVCCTHCDALVKSRDLYLLSDEQKRKEYQKVDENWNRRET